MHGPFDVDEIDLGDEQPQWIDLGSLLITPGPQQQLRMQVDEQTKQVQAVLLAGPDGALELMARQGGGRVEAVSEVTDGRQAQARFLFTATVELLEDLGFTRVRQVGKHAWIMSQVLDGPEG